MLRIDFDKTEPYFINGNFKWYIDQHFKILIENKQADNLPKLENIGCFIVKNDDIEDYVLINNEQNIIASYPYTFEGYKQMEIMINIIKISKHFDEYEKNNI